MEVFGTRVPEQEVQANIDPVLETGVTMEAKESSEQCRRERKEEGRVQKRQKIEASGGVRPRKREKRQRESARRQKNNRRQRHDKPQTNNQHRFGQVMDRVPCRNRPRFSTLSIALPGSVLSNCQTRELKTHMAGQIARACTLYHVDEIVVFDDNLSKGYHSGDTDAVDPSCAFLARVLQYCECPQYLRKNFFPRHPDLQFAGLLPPIDAPHHVRAEDRCRYREGVVVELRKKDPKSSLVNCGVRSRLIEYALALDGLSVFIDSTRMLTKLESLSLLELIVCCQWGFVALFRLNPKTMENQGRSLLER